VDPTEASVQRAMDTEAHPTASLESFGIDEQEVLRWYEIIAMHYARNPFSEQSAPGRRYYYANPNFPLADALALLGFMVENRPRRYIEVGAGFSSCAAIDINEQCLDGQVRMKFLDPYPETVLELLGDGSPYRDCVMSLRLQDTPLEWFAELEAGDILFMDSSHVAKTGSDVLDCFFRILPALRSGVLVHLHDIFFPFEYPREWIVQERRSWNEAYFLRAFLQGNASFRVLYFSDWMYKCRRDLLASRTPLCVTHRGGSLWMQRA
jgi:hypothetical protein